MELVPKWLREWIANLGPKQKNSGSGAVQMGNVAGPVQNVTQVHQHFYASPASHSQAASEQPRQVTDAQKEVLALLKQLDRPMRITVLEFMRREFKTAMVIELMPGQLYRVRRYVETVRRKVEKRERA
ncbi:hypothetical protein [Acidovorax sp. SUPP3334]|uniref:hypothetical protein n=1 Tax=Acidovorax sp. SUPP3334 TaxID=2920881 RepID=UPI0023DE5D63|nr:hypothetical protein [Acidovorax sp. SUPP3334]GKT22569.1 hypothetical protein AVHM3334_08860 [Acidovorax sp. SUPP3334]